MGNEISEIPIYFTTQAIREKMIHFATKSHERVNELTQGRDPFGPELEGGKIE